MEKAEEWKPEYYSQTTLKSFGFTAKMIETMLSEPLLKDNPHYHCAASADEPTIKRWMVNYVRHNLTSYDNVLYRMSGKVGCHDEYLTYKFAVLDKIAEAYPKLKQECNQQKQRAKSEHAMRMAYLTQR